MTVTYLGREAPSAADVVANVHRWQRQLDMPGSSKEEVDHLARKISVDGREGYVIDLLGSAGDTQKRILGAMIIEGDRVWFFKIMSLAPRIERHRSEFD